jgi:pimeloyl-ACP methyl ester carboxylesterase
VDDNDERVQIVQQIVDELELDNIVFMGHSRGSENALKMAALNQVS